MKSDTLNILICPTCHMQLQLQTKTAQALVEKGSLTCSSCGKAFPIQHGIPQFIDPSELVGLNKPLARLYDWFSLIYATFSKVGFLFLGTTEARARREVLDRLAPHGRVLEVSIGPGVNLPYLINRPEVTEVYGLDISMGQLKRCNTFLRRKKWPVDLFLANGEDLPFADASFDAVFHIGGINFFTNQQKAIDEMIRVAKPGTKIIVCDENEAGAEWYERFLPGFKGAFQGQREKVIPPVDLVPATMVNKKLEDIWNGFMYCLEFCTPG